MGMHWGSTSSICRLQESLREVLYNILIEFDVSMQLFMFFKCN
jgi:hypothetical protein